ncbi:MAG: CcdB family protein [Phenylobacterium sp.]|uniref:CcdB family protein n=1 Tax=Phenylobacterium sp. TaxID=1871053 RepID=UPI001A630DE0|nr:CcdB family protein [Phenylobacterium sp.]MBL8556059.1 CcdB family protein [Phenylobacterium sp.]
MRQFDLIENSSDRSRAHAPYFVLIQSHLFDPLESVVVAPVVRDAKRKMTGLDLAVEIEGEALVLSVGELFSIDRRLLRKVRGSVLEHEDAIRRALDRLFFGF